MAQTILDNWISRYGIPEQIHSDQGSQFTGHVFQELMELLDIKNTVTPPYNPRSNKVERFHRVLGEVIRSNSTRPVDDWVGKIPAALFAYRTTVSSVTGVTPFQALFGVNGRVPLDLLFPTPSEKQEEWSEFIQQVRTRMRHIHQEMREKIGLGIGRAAERSRRERKGEKYLEIGDHVYYFSPQVPKSPQGQTTRKFAILWTGPYVIQRKISDSLFVIYPIGEWAKRPREITAVIDKLSKIRPELVRQIPTPTVKIDLDKLQVDDEDFGEFVKNDTIETDSPETQIPIYTGIPTHEIRDLPPRAQAESHAPPDPREGEIPQEENGGWAEQESRDKQQLPPCDLESTDNKDPVQENLEPPPLSYRENPVEITDKFLDSGSDKSDVEIEQDQDGESEARPPVKFALRAPVLRSPQGPVTRSQTSRGGSTVGSWLTKRFKMAGADPDVLRKRKERNDSLTSEGKRGKPKRDSESEEKEGKDPAEMEEGEEQVFELSIDEEEREGFTNPPKVEVTGIEGIPRSARDGEKKRISVKERIQERRVVERTPDREGPIGIQTIRVLKASLDKEIKRREEAEAGRRRANRELAELRQAWIEREMDWAYHQEHAQLAIEAMGQILERYEKDGPPL